MSCGILQINVTTQSFTPSVFNELTQSFSLLKSIFLTVISYNSPYVLLDNTSQISAGFLDVLFVPNTLYSTPPTARYLLSPSRRRRMRFPTINCGIVPPSGQFRAKLATLLAITIGASKSFSTKS